MSEPLALTPAAWTTFESRLRTYVRQRVDSASADDVLGDILLRLVQHQRELQVVEKPTTWIYRVAANVITDHYRRRSVEQRALAQLEVELKDAMALSPVPENSVSAELEHCLIPLIQDLPAPYGDALLLTEIEGVPQNLAAKQLGVSNSGMKSRVQRGRAKLKQALLRCCEFEVNRRGAVLDCQRRLHHTKCSSGCT